MIADSREHGNFSFVHVHDISYCKVARNRKDIITVGTVLLFFSSSRVVKTAAAALHDADDTEKWLAKKKDLEYVIILGIEKWTPPPPIMGNKRHGLVAGRLSNEGKLI